MKKIILITLIFLFAISAVSFAKQGIFANVLNDAEQITIEGKVLSVPTPYSGQIGQGLVLDTENGDTTLYGLGPIWYWEQNQAVRPVAGDTVTAVAYKLDINGKLYYILKEITLADGKILKLRDDSTNLPLWINLGGKGHGKGFKGMGKGMHYNSSCPYNQ